MWLAHAALAARAALAGQAISAALCTARRMAVRASMSGRNVPHTLPERELTFLDTKENYAVPLKRF